MSKESRIATLNAVAEQKKQDCLERTEKAIGKLIQNQEKLSFGAIAREAGVSVSYLYKYPEIKERIQHLRRQQLEGVKKLTRPQTASEKSKQVIIQQLRERIKVLEYEKKELKQQNEKMTGQLYQTGIKLDLFDSVKQETLRQGEEIKKLKAELEATKNELAACQTKLIEVNPKVTPINQKIQQSVPDTRINDELNTRLSNLGIRLNATLKKIIASKTQQEIHNAISAVEEYLATDKKVKSKVGLFKTALEESWTPNLTDEERQLNKVNDNFSEWFKLAKEQGLVQASQGTKDGIIVMESTGEWTPLTTIIEKGWTLEYLQERRN
ncbi:MAG: DUF6262 family protein [Pleurocapsa sp. MO_226.B13]|nr:DUF6262 family protein [Pleurocapsa sp. MO_226.B13]